MASKKDILKEIVSHKRHEVSERKALFPIKLLEKSIYFETTPLSLVDYIRRPDKVGIIAEFKRHSPSKGYINQYASVERTSIGYMQAGASGLSVLTDQKYFSGKNEDLTEARNFNFCPILRKDFVVDEYQIIEAKSIGADVILLIAAALPPGDTRKLAQSAKELGLEVLLEVHSQRELDDHVNENLDLIGVNNRDLITFDTELETSLDLADHIPDQFLKVSESGLNDPKNVVQLMESGYEGFLIGEHFMRHGRPEKACADFIREIKSLMGK